MSTIDHFSTATAMLAALRAREISSVELAELHIARIEALVPPPNAIAIHTFERAREAARAADARLAAGETAPLLGLPMTLKESTLTAGLPQSAGIEALAGHVPAQDGPIARAVFDAGAALLGKTNIPVALGDWQADSPVYGRTNNPWDTTRTPGGSTGGGGAALAAGFTPLEVGSDIGGSIRVPAAYCGVFGHRPTETAIPRTGAFPFADLPNPTALLGVQGPLARCTDDLELLFDVLAGPEDGEHVGWRLDLPPPRATALGDFRVALCPPLPGVTASRAMRDALARLADQLSDAGARVETPDLPMVFEDYFADYLRILTVMINQGTPAEDRHAMAASLRESDDPVRRAQAEGLVMDAPGYIMAAHRRAAAQAAWRRFFEDWDIVAAPMVPDVAFPHQTGAMADRTLTIDNESVNYFANILYPMLAIFPGLPSTAFPAGRSAEGLPVGLQAIGPYLEDRTPMAFARALEAEGWAFTPPPGY